MALDNDSLALVADIHPDLKHIVTELSKEMDIVVKTGHRDHAAQVNAFNLGTSRHVWPNSRHNTLPSMAVDIVPKDAANDDVYKFREMLRRIERIADLADIKIQLGRDFQFREYCHIQLHSKHRKT